MKIIAPLIQPVTFFFIALCLSSCKSDEAKHLFTKIESHQSGIDFSNELHDDDSSYSFINEFGYMGGGVGIGDFNNDGLKDIFFTGNQVTCRLYINQGENRFKDITENAGLITRAWCTGVSIVDLNQDGFDDIYICVFGKDLKRRSKNLLYINDHNLGFRESADDYGLADTSFSTQAAFFDYDRDGDLDMYLTNYLLSPSNSNTVFPRDRSGYSPANDRLYRNDGDSAGSGHPIFSDQTLQANIKEDGYGLGISVSDFNNDGWPDVYVGNDFISNDLLWQNNKDGTFTNVIAGSMRHQSYSSMGTDAADLNNDMLTDLVTLDMLPETNERKKTTYSLMNYERYEAERRMGYEPEFMRNMLQLNNGNSTAGNTGTPFFSEIGRLANIHATDWSWSVLLADLNNDGWKDMHITNGIGRDFINADFLEFSNNLYTNSLNKEDKQKAIQKELASLDNVNLSNYLFLNNKNLQFTDFSHEGGIDELSMSNGAAFADLDNDGDLDLVTNNINKAAFLFINNTNRPAKAASSHFLKIKLKGESSNRQGFGSKLTLYQPGNIQQLEQNPVRGYFSSVDQDLFFGLGVSGKVDSVRVVWPDGRQQLLTNIKSDTVVTVVWSSSLPVVQQGETPHHTIFTDITGSGGLSYLHQESSFNDYVAQRLLPQKYSQLGPFIDVSDINGDKIADFFIGGAFNFSGKLFTQNNQREFDGLNLVDSIKYAEDHDCLFFDVDRDGDNDLLVTSGGMQYESESPYYQPKLYLNNGKGKFSLSDSAIPTDVRTMAGCATVGDYDNDGDLDLFIGGRISLNYPLSPRSFLLQNNNGIFKDVTKIVCPALQTPGMLTAALWTDFNADGRIDLVVAGEWMPIRFFKNFPGHLAEATDSTELQQMNGMWRSLLAADVDNDGDTDLVAGNLGLNCEYGVSPDRPMQLFATDLDNNGSIDPFFFYYIRNSKGRAEPVPGYTRGRLSEQVPGLKKKFLLHKNFANAGYDEIFKDIPEGAIHKFHCDETRTCWLENVGEGKFRKHILPLAAQYSPVNAINCEDFDGDGNRDLLLAGNEYQAEVMTGPYDASYGCFLQGSNNKVFRPLPPQRTGFILTGDVKDLAVVRHADGSRIVIAAINNDSMRVFKVNIP
ncbi:FG-GAP-like repeat-containing protein [Flavitalea antarctica]